MKKFRKFTAMVTAIALAGCMMTSVSILNVSAENATYSITITNPNDGGDHTYASYQIFTGTVVEKNGKKELNNIEWGTGVNSDSLLSALKDSADWATDGVDFSACENAGAVAQQLEKITSNSADADKFASIVADNLSGVFGTLEDLNGGYYFIKDSANSNPTNYSKYVLKLTDDTTIAGKVGTPSAMKKVKEDDTDLHEISDYTDSRMNYTIDTDYNDVADYDIGEDVPFMLYGSMPSNIDEYTAYRYIFHDTLGTEFTANDDIVVTIDNKIVDVSCYSTLADVSDTITVRFNDILSATSDSEAITITKDSIVKVSYTAKLNDTANLGQIGQNNAVYLEYSNNPNWDGTGKENDSSSETEDTTNKTTEDKVVVFTYELDTTKIDGSTKTSLQGAKFKLSKGTGENKVYLKQENNLNSWVTSIDEATEFESGVNGKFTIKGIDSGTYYLTETVAPTNYNQLTSDIEVVLTAATANGQSWENSTNADALTSLSVTADNVEGTADVSKGIATITVANNKGSSLPSTGGIGTTIFYTVGGVLVVGAGVTLIAKKRAKNEQ